MNVICGVVKDFLTHLREPILTFRLHNTFMAAIGNVALLYKIFNGGKKLSVEKLLCVWEEECGSLHWGGGDYFIFRAILSVCNQGRKG